MTEDDDVSAELARRGWRLIVEPAYFLDPSIGTIGLQVILDPDPECERSAAAAEVVHHEDVSDAAVLDAARRLMERIDDTDTPVSPPPL